MHFNEDLLLRRRDELHRQGIRILFMGDMDDPRIPARNRHNMAETTSMTAGNSALNLVFAFNYGSRNEIAAAARQAAAEAAAGTLEPASIGPHSIAARLYVPDMPDVDLIIRTSGEYRLSNFLLWQAAYAEFVFPEVLWPDFTPDHLIACIAEFQRRGRRFGGT